MYLDRAKPAVSGQILEEFSAISGPVVPPPPTRVFMSFDGKARVDCPSRVGLMRGALGEFLAMAIFVFVGCGAAASNLHKSDPGTPDFPAGSDDWDPSAVVAVALNFGFAITVLAFATAHSSGGHINFAGLKFCRSLGFSIWLRLCFVELC